jgi:hypothetical protein
VACTSEPTQFDVTSSGSTEAGDNGNSKDSPQKVRFNKAEMTTASEPDSTIEKIDMKGKVIIGSEKWPNIFWLNFEGTQLNASQSFIIKDARLTELTVPPFAASDVSSSQSAAELKETVLQQVKELFLGVHVRIQTDKPSDTDLFSSVHIGGSNFTGQEKLLGIAPLDLDNFNARDQIFVFSKDLNLEIEGEAIALLSQVIAHEIAHALGLRHIENENAVMNPSVLFSTNGFDEEGTYTDGSGKENSLEVLKRNVGAGDLTKPATSIPKIRNLAAKNQGNIGQFSVFDIRNMTQNPNHKLGDFNYTWFYKEFPPVQGPSVRIAFNGSASEVLKLEVSNGTEKETFLFTVSNPRNQ